MLTFARARLLPLSLQDPPPRPPGLETCLALPGTYISTVSNLRGGERHRSQRHIQHPLVLRSWEARAGLEKARLGTLRMRNPDPTQSPGLSTSIMPSKGGKRLGLGEFHVPCSAPHMLCDSGHVTLPLWVSAGSPRFSYPINWVTCQEPSHASPLQ